MSEAEIGFDFLLFNFKFTPINQLHIYRNGKKVLILAGKAAPKVIREDALCGMLPKKIK